MFDVREVSWTMFPSEEKGIFVIHALQPINPCSWVRNNQEQIDEILLKQGGILLRGFDIQSLSEFEVFSELICPKLLRYEYCSTPRTVLANRIYSSTEYPSDQHILLHNENSYSNCWPEKILFFCMCSPQSGGETPVADSRKVLRRIQPDIVKIFNEKQVSYVRNYIKGIDLTWQEVFQTDERSGVELYCQKHAINVRWNQTGPELTTKQQCQATWVHPKTKETVWFNQAHLFHSSGLPKILRELMIEDFGEHSLPRNAYFGDGTSIPVSTINAIKKSYEQESIIFAWQKNDVLILDNVLMAHGRRPFSGERKIAVAMG